MNTAITQTSYGTQVLSHMTDDAIRAKIVEVGDKLMARAIPGANVAVENRHDLAPALSDGKADFTVEKHPIMVVNHVDGLSNPDAAVTPHAKHMATVRTDTMTTLGIVGEGYGVVQTDRAMGALSILAERGDVDIRKVEQIDGGAKVRVTALLGVTEFASADGAPNTLGHLAIFEATHDGSASTTVQLFTIRVECFNGMTSQSIVKKHALRHTSLADKRVDQLTQDVLDSVLGDVEAEKAFFESLVNTAMNRDEFIGLATDLLGGALDEDASKSKVTRFGNELEELIGYFDGGNQGAGATAWGGYNSVTRWIEAKREGITDTAKADKRFDSNLNGDGQAKIKKAVRYLKDRFGAVTPEPSRRSQIARR